MFLFSMSYVRLPTRKTVKQGFMVSGLVWKFSQGKPVRVWEADKGKREHSTEVDWLSGKVSQRKLQPDLWGNPWSVNLPPRCLDLRKESWCFIHWFQATPEKWERHKVKSPHTFYSPQSKAGPSA